MFKFRPHRGTLTNSMSEVVELESKQALVDKVVSDLSDFEHELIINHNTVKLEPYGKDERVDWDTHIVTIDGYGVFGFTNKFVHDTSEE